MIKSVGRTLALVAAVSLGAVACSSSGGKSSSENTAITAAMNKWAAASTPAQACAAVTVAFAGVLGGGGAASECPTHIVASLGTLETGTAKIKKVSVANGVAIVNAIIPTNVPTYTDFYFVQENGTWKLNSIGKPAPAVPSGAPPPGSPPPGAPSPAPASS
ncbi:MAG TPA: hypothetical protein VGL75_05570 [Acidothermaceae bacterium]|jgi:hypothetical protein